MLTCVFIWLCFAAVVAQAAAPAAHSVNQRNGFHGVLMLYAPPPPPVSPTRYPDTALFRVGQRIVIQPSADVRSRMPHMMGREGAIEALPPANKKYFTVRVDGARSSIRLPLTSMALIETPAPSPLSARSGASPGHQRAVSVVTGTVAAAPGSATSSGTGGAGGWAAAAAHARAAGAAASHAIGKSKVIKVKSKVKPKGKPKPKAKGTKAAPSRKTRLLSALPTAQWRGLRVRIRTGTHEGVVVRVGGGVVCTIAFTCGQADVAADRLLVFPLMCYRALWSAMGRAGCT